MRIKSHALGIYAAMSAAGVFTLSFMGIYVWGMRQEGRDRWFFYAFITPFVLVGTVLTVFGVRALLRAAWFGRWALDVPAGGGVLGQPLVATLFPTRTRTPSGELTCRLRSVRVVSVAGQGRTSGPSDRQTLWETTWTVPAGTIHPRIGLPLTLPLPDAGQPTNVDPRTATGTLWQLDVVVPTGGSTEQAVFDLPVRAL